MVLYTMGVCCRFVLYRALAVVVFLAKVDDELYLSLLENMMLCKL